MSNSERWQKIEQLYHAAATLAPDARAELLAGADEDVRQEVESLLRVQGTAETLDHCWRKRTGPTCIPAGRAVCDRRLTRIS